MQRLVQPQLEASHVFFCSNCWNAWDVAGCLDSHVVAMHQANLPGAPQTHTHTCRSPPTFVLALPYYRRDSSHKLYSWITLDPSIVDTRRFRLGASLHSRVQKILLPACLRITRKARSAETSTLISNAARTNCEEQNECKTKLQC